MTSTSSERTSALDGEILVLLAELIDFVTHDVGVDAAVVGQSLGQLAALDRHRERELHRLRRIAVGPAVQRRSKTLSRRRFHKFFGAPYSYRHAFR
jgi:hypothetical protein